MSRGEDTPVGPRAQHGEPHGQSESQSARGPRNDPDNPFFVISLPEHLAEVRAIAEEIIRWVERADLKATILIGGAGAMFGGELIFYPDAVKTAVTRGGGWKWLVPAFLVASMVVLTVVGFFAAWAVYPQLGRRYRHTEGELLPGDLIYFGRLRLIPTSEFVTGIADTLEQRTLIGHYAEQIQFNSKVAWTKYTHIRTSLRWFGLAALLALGSLVAYAVAGGPMEWPT